MVPKAGLEPARAEARRILSPLRLPISPLRHKLGGIEKTEVFSVKIFIRP